MGGVADRGLGRQTWAERLDVPTEGQGDQHAADTAPRTSGARAIEARWAEPEPATPGLTMPEPRLRTPDDVGELSLPSRSAPKTPVIERRPPRARREQGEAALSWADAPPPLELGRFSVPMVVAFGLLVGVWAGAVVLLASHVIAYP